MNAAIYKTKYRNFWVVVWVHFRSDFVVSMSQGSIWGFDCFPAWDPSIPKGLTKDESKETNRLVKSVDILKAAASSRQSEFLPNKARSPTNLSTASLCNYASQDLVEHAVIHLGILRHV